MAMSSTTLASALSELVLASSNTDDAIAAWVDSWAIYFQDSQAGAIPFNSVAPQVSQMKTVMETFMAGLGDPVDSTPYPAALALQTAITRWWLDLAANIVVIYPGALSISSPPIGLSSIATLLSPVFDSNRLNALSSGDALSNVAEVIHAQNLGGLAVIPPATPVAII